MKRRAMTLLGLCIAVTSATGVGSAYSDGHDLHGGVRFDPAAEVVLTVTENRRVVVFRARNVTFTCEDGVVRRTFPPVKAKVKRDGNFERSTFSAATSVPDQYFFWLKGRLHSRDRAKGFFMASYDPWDPPGSENEAECSTFGKLRWKVGP